MTPEQIELARHALGLPNKRRQSYRNHFVCGQGHPDWENWQDMVAAGLAKTRKGNALTGGYNWFWLTLDGAHNALRKGERLDLEDFPSAASLTPQDREPPSS